MSPSLSFMSSITSTLTPPSYLLSSCSLPKIEFDPSEPRTPIGRKVTIGFGPDQVTTISTKEDGPMPPDAHAHGVTRPPLVRPNFRHLAKAIRAGDRCRNRKQVPADRCQAPRKPRHDPPQFEDIFHPFTRAQLMAVFPTLQISQDYDERHGHLLFSSPSRSYERPVGREPRAMAELPRLYQKMRHRDQIY